MTIRWITENLGTAPWSAELAYKDVNVVDVRSLRDATGNSPLLIKEKVLEISNIINQGGRVVICCDYGISRSNAIAAAVLSQVAGTSLNDSLRRVVCATGETRIKIDLIDDIRSALGMRFNTNIVAKVLILGADEFIGGYINSVVNPDRYIASLCQQNLIDDPILLDSTVMEYSTERIIFCWHPPQLDTNLAAGHLISSLRNVLEVCRVRGIALTFLSGHQVFSGRTGYGVQSCLETDTLCPAGAVGDALFLAETLIKQYGQRNNLRFLIVRFSHVYGYGDKRPWLLNTIIRQALAHCTIQVHEFDNGFPKIGLTHVKNLAYIVKLATEENLTGILHVSPDKVITTYDLALLIKKQTNSASRIVAVKFPNNYSMIRLDSVTTLSSLESTSKVKLESGLLELVKNMVLEEL
ncbi:sugar nucleotide-binding protein [Aeromonas enteropelogenes]|uniref:sugar nucleotide-binding protein n=1 Tax=Aeromonas enteropelogenes TaxID=29489 RepID=UPI003988C301